MGFEADLVRWVESFIEERKVNALMDGKGGESMDVETEIPQELPVLPRIFGKYLLE